LKIRKFISGKLHQLFSPALTKLPTDNPHLSIKSNSEVAVSFSSASKLTQLSETENLSREGEVDLALPPLANNYHYREKGSSKVHSQPKSSRLN
jgi:hypothetical protein